jgi:hypothetical protein
MTARGPEKWGVAVPKFEEVILISAHKSCQAVFRPHSREFSTLLGIFNMDPTAQKAIKKLPLFKPLFASLFDL